MSVELPKQGYNGARQSQRINKFNPKYASKGRNGPTQRLDNTYFNVCFLCGKHCTLNSVTVQRWLQTTRKWKGLCSKRELEGRGEDKWECQVPVTMASSSPKTLQAEPAWGRYLDRTNEEKSMNQDPWVLNTQHRVCLVESQSYSPFHPEGQFCFLSSSVFSLVCCIHRPS